MPLFEQLKSHPFTQGMSEPMLKKLGSLVSELRFSPDQVVFRARDESYECCLVTAGSFRVELGTPVYTVLIQTLGPGEVFGWSALLDNPYSLFQVRAQEPSRALCLDGPKLSQACARDPKLAAEVYRRIALTAARRIQAIELRLVEFCGTRSRDPGSGEVNPSASSAA